MRNRRKQIRVRCHLPPPRGPILGSGHLGYIFRRPGSRGKRGGILQSGENWQRYTCDTTRKRYDPGEPDGLHGIGGGPLRGDKWVRILYLDESGVGKITKDPHLVISGVLINGDKQWGPLKAHLKSLLEGAVPAGAPTPKYLHAVDIFHGSGEFPRALWPESVRHELLDNLARIPAQFHVPVVWAAVDRAQRASLSPKESTRQHLIDAYTEAALICFMQTEWYMRTKVGEGELASIIIEQNNELQKRIKAIYRAVNNYDIMNQIIPENKDISPHLLPITRVIDEPSFQEKTVASILQLADFCAFAFKRAEGKHHNYQRLLKPLAPAVLKRNPRRIPPFIGPSWE